jgi:GH24 family phage-related lysozyme (muramidase)
MLETRLENDFRKPLQKCIVTFDLAPISVQASMLDLSYNVGIGAACKSTAARRMTERKWRDACHAMTLYNRAGGKVIDGLKKRREYGDGQRIGELELCLAGLG